MTKQIIQHCIFGTYKRRRVLKDAKIIEFLYNSFNEIAKAKGFEIVACKILEDHIHILIRYDAQHRIEYVMQMIKGQS